MKTTKVKIFGDIENKLYFIKHLKVASGLGLKEAKFLCDDICDGKKIEVEIYTSELANFKDAVLVSGDNLKLDDVSYYRNKKLLQLGLGNKKEYIKFIVCELKYKSDSQLTDIFSELPEDVLLQIINEL